MSLLQSISDIRDFIRNNIDIAHKIDFGRHPLFEKINSSICGRYRFYATGLLFVYEEGRINDREHAEQLLDEVDILIHAILGVYESSMKVMQEQASELRRVINNNLIMDFSINQNGLGDGHVQIIQKALSEVERSISALNMNHVVLLDNTTTCASWKSLNLSVDDAKLSIMIIVKQKYE